jgi:hypothetical protein
MFLFMSELFITHNKIITYWSFVKEKNLRSQRQYDEEIIDEKEII